MVPLGQSGTMLTYKTCSIQNHPGLPLQPAHCQKRRICIHQKRLLAAERLLAGQYRRLWLAAGLALGGCSIRKGRFSGEITATATPSARQSARKDCA